LQAPVTTAISLRPFLMRGDLTIAKVAGKGEVKAARLVAHCASDPARTSLRGC